MFIREYLLSIRNPWFSAKDSKGQRKKPLFSHYNIDVYTSATVISKIFHFLSQDTLIVSDVKFNNGPLEVEEVKKTRIRKNSIDIELKRKQEEEYNTEVREQRYKRLMHLLHRSKFYSSYLKSKIKDDTNKKKKVVRKRKHSPVNDENIPPIKKKSRKVVEEYNIQEYISTEVSNKI